MSSTIAVARCRSLEAPVETPSRPKRISSAARPSRAAHGAAHVELDIGASAAEAHPAEEFRVHIRPHLVLGGERLEIVVEDGGQRVAVRIWNLDRAIEASGATESRVDPARVV